MTLRTVRLGGDDGIDRASEELLDDSVCDCCATTAAMTSSGPLVIYRDRTESEVRDHRAVRGERVEGGIHWNASEPLPADGWRIPACPVNGPAAGRLGETVWAAWFTAEGGNPRVLAAVSADGGRTFGEPIPIDGDGPLGRLDLEVLPSGDGHAVISWLGRDETGAVIRLRRLGADGRLGPTVDAVRAEGSRASGVPRLLLLPGGTDPMGRAGEAAEQHLVLAWVDPGGDERPRTIRLAGFPASGVPAPARP
jgi:hypothetical protein